MALTTIDFMDGFDHYTTILDKWSTTSGGGLAISNGNGRQGTSSLRITGTNSVVSKSLGVNRSTISVGFGYRHNVAFAANTIFRLLETGTVHVDLRLQGDGTLQVTRNGTSLGVSTFALSQSTYVHIEIKAIIHDSTGAVTVWVNGDAKITLTNVDTRNGGTGVVNQIAILQTAAGTSADYDDLIVGDDQIGDQHIKTKFPDAVGNYSEWTPTAGSNYQNVDEAAPDGNTTTNTSDAVDERDTYGFQDATAGENILAVAHNMVLTKTDAGTCSVAPLLRHSSTDYVGTAVNPSDSSYLNFQQIYMAHPNTDPWDTTNMNATEFGVKRTA